MATGRSYKTVFVCRRCRGMLMLEGHWNENQFLISGGDEGWRTYRLPDGEMEDYCSLRCQQEAGRP